MTHGAAECADPRPVRKLRIAELDALRGIAAMAVVLFHFTTIYGRAHPDACFSPAFLVDWGTWGVLLFFMISGFVISLTAEKSQNAIQFLIARAARLYPAYWASIILAVVVATAGGPGVRWTDAIVNASMVQEAFGVHNVCEVYWTLYIELQFYAVVTLFLACGRLRLLPWYLLLLLTVDTVATFPQAWDRVPGWWRLTLWFPLLRHLYLFVFGIWMYRARFHQDRWSLLVAGVCLVNRIGKGLPIDGILVHLGLGGLFAIAVFGFLPHLKWRPLVWLGTISYSLYLCHMNLGFLVIDRCLANGIGADGSVIVATALSIGVSALMQRSVEQPGHDQMLRWIRSHWRSDDSARSVCVAGAAAEDPR